MKLTESAIKRHRKLFRFLKRIAAKLFVKSYNITYETPKLPPAPYIVVANHNADLDPALLGINLPQMYFVASEHIFENPILCDLFEFVFSPKKRRGGRLNRARNARPPQTGLQCLHFPGRQ